MTNKNRTSGNTTDYSKFILSKKNRGTRDSHVKALAESMVEHGNQSAITCNIKTIDGKEFYQIIDGQHRFKACELLDIPVEYDVWHKMDINAMSYLNENQKKWTMDDYLHFNMTNTKNPNYEDYVKLNKYYQETLKKDNKISVTGLVVSFDLTQDTMKQKMRAPYFKAGIWKMTTEKEGLEILEIMDVFLASGVKNAGHSKLILALGKMFLHPSFNKERLINQIKKIPDPLPISYNTESDYLWELQRIYNHGIEDIDEKIIFLKSELSGTNARKISKMVK